MWYCPEKYKEKEILNVNEELLGISGNLENKEAKITLARFLRANLGFTAELVSGIKLAPYQEITLKAFFNRNFNMCIWGRGCGKSFIAAVYCFLQCVFEPNTKILIAGPTFRTARFIFNNLEKIVQGKDAELLLQCFGAKTRRNDQFEWLINGGSITAIPLSGEKIRGFRANVLVLDEYLLLPEEIIKTVLMPFLVAPQDIHERIRIREVEDKLIESGEMKEEDRIKFENNSKMIALSSASYTFENCYKVYKDWIGKIESKDDDLTASYFVSQLGYQALPEEMIDKTIIDEAASGGSSHSSFQREYCAHFTDGSDSYFSAVKMEACTLKIDERPHTLLQGNPEKKYILGIDPNLSDSPSADFFAIAVMEVDDETGQGTLVHSYQGLGSLSKHVKYLTYLLDMFNVVFICIDNAGADVFIDTCNESAEFKKLNYNLKDLDFNTDKEGEDYVKILKDTKLQYNLESKRIVFKQVFTSNFIRRGNEHLQACIDYKKVWFASRSAANESFFNEVINTKLPRKLIFIDDKSEWTTLDLIDHQDDLVFQTKKQCTLVEFTTTARGSQNFDLPLHLRKSSSPNKARKDNYSAFMLGNWGIKCYSDIMNQKAEVLSHTFDPVMIY
jgi:hypothetical protein